MSAVCKVLALERHVNVTTSNISEHHCKYPGFPTEHDHAYQLDWTCQFHIDHEAIWGMVTSSLSRTRRLSTLVSGIQSRPSAPPRDTSSAFYWFPFSLGFSYFSYGGRHDVVSVTEGCLDYLRILHSGAAARRSLEGTTYAQHVCNQLWGMVMEHSFWGGLFTRVVLCSLAFLRYRGEMVRLGWKDEGGCSARVV